MHLKNSNILDLGDIEILSSPDGVMRSSQVQEMIVAQVPLTVLVSLEYGHGSISEGSQHSPLDMAETRTTLIIAD